MAPTPPIAPSQPRPLSPAWRMSLANTGSRVWYGIANTVVTVPINISPMRTLLFLNVAQPLADAPKHGNTLWWGALHSRQPWHPEHE